MSACAANTSAFYIQTLISEILAERDKRGVGLQKELVEAVIARQHGGFRVQIEYLASPGDPALSDQPTAHYRRWR